MKANPRFKSYYLWVCQHPSLFLFLFGGTLCALYTWALYCMDAPAWCIILVDLLIVLCALSIPSNCAVKLVMLANSKLSEECDPYPFMEEINRQLSANKSKQHEQILMIDKCVAWLYLGEYQQVLDTLNNINIDRFVGTPPIQKLIYYNNLSDICTKTDRFEQADAWYQKQVQIYEALKSKKQKEAILYTMESARAFALYRKQEYTMAINAFSALPYQSLLQRVESTVFIARCHLALNQKNEARSALCFVVANGNKTALVEEARKLLEQL